MTAFDVRYIAAPGETNAVVVTIEGANVRISDPGATISAGPGCVAAGADVLCDITQTFVEMFVAFDDGDDSADLSDVDSASVSGGAGNDQVVGARLENFSRVARGTTA